MKFAAIVSVVLVLAGCGGRTEEPLTSAPPTAETTTTSRVTANPTQTPSSSNLQPSTSVTSVTTSTSVSQFDPAQALATGWTTVETTEFFGRAGIEPQAVANSPEGWVAIVSHRDGVGDTRAVLSFSSDRVTWQQVDSTPFSGAEINAVAANSDGFVAVGSACRPGSDLCLRDPAVWHSSDGLTWGRVPHDSEVFPGCSSLDTYPFPFVDEEAAAVREMCDAGEAPAQVELVRATEHGFVAVGSRLLGGVIDWYSEDGLAWTRVGDTASPEYPGPSWAFGTHGRVGILTADGLVQPGERCVKIYEGDEWMSNDCLGFVWTSTDGDHWVHEENGYEAFSAAFIEDVFATPGGVVAVGYQPGCMGEVTSQVPGDGDGLQRQAAEFMPWHLPPAVDHEANPGVEATFYGPEIWNWREQGPFVETAVAWFSEDGHRWDATVFEEARSLKVASTSFGLVALAANKNTDSGTVWYSADGKQWQQVEAGEHFANFRPSHLAAYGDTILATSENEGVRRHLAWSPPN